MALNGTPLADRLAARFDQDAVFGLGGADALTNNSFNDTYLDGGLDNDRLSSTYELWRLVSSNFEAELALTEVGGAGNDIISASTRGEVSELVDTVDARLNLVGGPGKDTISVSIGGTVFWMSANSSVTGGSGDDAVTIIEDVTTSVGEMNNSVRAGDGNDYTRILTFGNFQYVTNTVFGEAGDDTIIADAVSEEWDGVTGATAFNEISGGDGNDLIRATAHGHEEFDAVGRNVVSGDAGDDRIEGDGWNSNELSGGTGNDVILATLVEEWDYSINTYNTLDGGDGDDFLSASGRVNTYGSSSEDVPPSVLTNRLTGGLGNDTLRATALVDDHGGGGSARNVLLEGDGNDNLRAVVQAGTLGANRLFGDSGNDRLQVVGGNGNLLQGGLGRDVLIGGTGTDTFAGATNVDTFVFSATTGGLDVIADFAAEDRVALIGLVDRGAPGLFDDFVRAVDTVVRGPQEVVDVHFDDGARVEFHGIAGQIDSVTDFIRAGQIVDAAGLGIA